MIRIKLVNFSGRLQKDEIPPSGKPVILGNLPLFHAYGMNLYLITCLARSTEIHKIILLPRFVEEDFLRCIQVNEMEFAEYSFNFQWKK